MIDVSTMILGGGWTGIIFALELKRAFPSENIIVVEKSNSLGGLLRSRFIKGHLLDIGGSHVIFSHNKYLLSRILSLLDNNFVKHVRKAYVLLNSILVPYPFENGLYVLPPEERAEALVHFLEAWISRDEDWRPKTFKDWIYGFFGKWIAEKYLVPYNVKIWKRSLDDIDSDWVYTPGRLPIPDWRDIVRSAIGIPTIGYVEQSIFYYPKYGGIQSLFDSAVKEAKKLGIKFLTNINVSEVKRTHNGWLINGKFRARRLVSTIPLKDLIKMLDAPTEIIRASEKLDYNKVAVIGIALKRAAPTQHWIYVPDDNIAFHRYAWISNYSPKNAPKGQSTMLVEATLSPNDRITTEDLTDKVVTDLERLDVIREKDVIFARGWIHEYGYPIYRIGHNKIREQIIQWLDEQGIISIGRWGSWHYWNTDKIYEEVLKTISKLKAEC